MFVWLMVALVLNVPRPRSPEEVFVESLEGKDGGVEAESQLLSRDYTVFPLVSIMIVNC